MIEKYIRRTHDETLEEFGLSWGEVRVLGSLRYGGAPYRSTPGRLGSQLDLSSGAMTARLDKMEAADLIRRLPDPSDRRGVLIELTDHGKELFEQSVALQIEKESIVAATLDDARARSAERPPPPARDRVHGRVRAALEAARLTASRTSTIPA